MNRQLSSLDRTSSWNRPAQRSFGGEVATLARREPGYGLCKKKSFAVEMDVINLTASEVNKF
ncbi:MAG: hypothetical protein R3307_02680 [Anaerolineales bacterium]|nr:hypothetical protein [Anaerolineales bacterium]